MLDNLSKYKLILGSQSPRRKELLQGLGLKFQTRFLRDVDESYPLSLKGADIPLYIACKKAKAYMPSLSEDELLITADTIVWIDGQTVGKPKNEADARRILHLLSGRTHQVFTGVCLSTLQRQVSFSDESTVCFVSLTDEEIDFYIEHDHPFDKAGAYGIQEWIGYVGIAYIEGSFYNVMGLPVQRLYKELRKF
jgi:septum formation protein